MTKRKRVFSKGITLIALVITIIILLILAGVGISTLTGEGGILTKAKEAEEKHKQAEQEERNSLDKLYSSIKVATDDNAEITISMKDLKSFIAEQMGIEGIHEKSLLMTSTNTSLEVETINLSSFSNTFHEKFAEYFEYNETTGELTCLKEGEYLVMMELSMCTYTSSSSSWVSGVTYCKVNDIILNFIKGTTSYKTADADDCNSIRVFLKKGDKLSFLKETSNAKPSNRNVVNIRLIKM